MRCLVWKYRKNLSYSGLMDERHRMMDSWSFQEDSTAEKEIRDLTPARRRWREGSRGGSISSNNSGLPEYVRSVLWKLAYKQLGPEDWKKLALHWAFTQDQIRAIEHQYTGKIICLNLNVTEIEKVARPWSLSSWYKCLRFWDNGTFTRIRFEERKWHFFLRQLS